MTPTREVLFTDCSAWACHDLTSEVIGMRGVAGGTWPYIEKVYACLT